MTYFEPGLILPESGDPNKSSNFVSRFAYQELERSGSSPLKELPKGSFPLPSSSFSISGPPGDRMGTNKEDFFLQELMDFLVASWLTQLASDYVTEDGKIVNRIEFYKDAKLRTYDTKELKTLLGENRFLNITSLESRIEVRVPENVTLAINRRPGVFPKFTLRGPGATMEMTYSVPGFTRRRSSIHAKVRITFVIIPKSIWRVNLKKLRRGVDIFSSDLYVRSAQEVLENLELYLPPSS